eukprot:gene28444-39023_t
MAWWDYGYQITGVGNRTTIADGNTWNHEHIATLGRCLTSPERKAHRLIRHLADYVLIWTGGGGDDLAKSPHMARICNSVYSSHCPGDPTCSEYSFTDGYERKKPTPMMNASLLYRMHGHNQVTQGDTVNAAVGDAVMVQMAEGDGALGVVPGDHPVVVSIPVPIEAVEPWPCALSARHERRNDSSANAWCAGGGATMGETVLVDVELRELGTVAVFHSTARVQPAARQGLAVEGTARAAQRGLALGPVVGMCALLVAYGMALRAASRSDRRDDEEVVLARSKSLVVDECGSAAGTERGDPPAMEPSIAGSDACSVGLGRQLRDV